MEDQKTEESELPDLARLRLPLALTIVGLTLLSAGIYFTLHKTSEKDIKFTQNQSASGSATIVVHIAGEVTKPGVYLLPSGSRVNDLIEKAGGFTKEASQEFIQKTLNLALVIKDGSKIYIPGDNEGTLGTVAGVSQKAGALINVNTALLAELDLLSDIGPVRGQKIIENRPYATIEELVEKKVISPATLEKIREKQSVY